MVIEDLGKLYVGIYYCYNLWHVDCNELNSCHSDKSLTVALQMFEKALTPEAIERLKTNGQNLQRAIEQAMNRPIFIKEVEPAPSCVKGWDIDRVNDR